MDLIKETLEGTKLAEAPKSYFYWALLVALAAVVKNNVWLERYLFKTFRLYPNIFVILVGKSGLRKGVPIWFCEQLVAGVNNTRIINGRTTIPGVLSDLSKVYTREGQPPISDATALLLASEFASFIIEDPKEALTILTNIYDSQYTGDNWKYNTKHEPFQLKNICISMLAASNQTHLKDALPPNAIGGGFLARTFMIVESKKNASNPLTRAPVTQLDLAPMIKVMKEKALLKGAMSFSESAMELYEAWYKKYDEKDIDDPTGTSERLTDSILKVAMLISLARKDTLLIDEQDMDDAINSASTFIRAAHQTTMGQNSKSEVAPQSASVMKTLYESKEFRMSRKKILRKLWGECDAMVFDRVISTLDQAGIVSSVMEGSEVMYILTHKGRDIVMNTLED